MQTQRTSTPVLSHFNFPSFYNPPYTLRAFALCTFAARLCQIAALLLTGRCELLSQNWVRQHPIESGWMLRSISVVDSMHAWAAGWHASAAGLIVRTTDGGNNWIELTRSLPLYLNDIRFVTDSLGWVVGGDNNQYSGFIRRTTDMGQSWTMQLTDPNNRFWAVFFLDRMRGWVCGDSGKILATSNGGSDWQTQYRGRRTIGFADVHVFPDGKGWCGGSFVLRTTNFGVQWDSISNIQLNRFSFLNDSTGWAVASSGSYAGFNWKTTDGGRTWVGWHLSGMYPTDVEMLSDSLVYTTILDWRVDPPLPRYPTTLRDLRGTIDTRASYLFGIAFSKSGRGFAVGAGDIVGSGDSGRTWINQVGPLRRHLTAIDMADSLVGWVVSDLQLVMRTTNGGHHWNVQTPVYWGDLFALSCVSRQHIFAGGTHLMSSTNGGETWARTPTPGNWTISDFSFVDTRRGWFAAFEHRVFRTVDGGVSWTEQQLPSGGFGLSSIDFVDSSYGWCAGASGRIDATTNGGLSWFRQISGATSPQEFRSVDFVDRSYGWAAGQALIVRTTNGGDRWETSYVSQDAWFRDIKFVNHDTGWAVGERERILVTTNGGVTWIIQQQGGGPGDPDLYSVDAVSSRLVWISGQYGEILHTTNGGGITAVELVHEELPARFELDQNYPNPFNSTTKIRFAVTTSGFVSLGVYDMLGREVETLIEGDLPAGRYEASLDASRLASGIYYYRLLVGGVGVVTKKMILIR